MPRRIRRTPLNRDRLAGCVINSVLKSNKLGFCTLNIQSIKNKMDEFRYTFKDSRATIISVSETWATSDISDSFLKLEGYKMIRHDRKRKRGGGLAIYVKDNIGFSVLEKSEGQDNTEYVIFELFLGYMKILVMSLYNPPMTDCLTLLEDKLSEYYLRYDDVILTGDLNIDFLGGSRHFNRSNQIKNLFNSFNMTNFVSSPTHFSNLSSAALDYLVGSDPDQLLVFSQINVAEFSKHDVIFCSLDYDIVFEQPKIQKFRNYSNFDLNVIENEFQLLSWTDYFTIVDPNRICNYLYNNLNQLHDALFPEKVYQPSKIFNPWYNRVIQKAMIDRDLAYIKWKSSRNSTDFVNFKMLRNRVRTISRDARQQYLTRYLNPNLPNKTLWQRLNDYNVTKDKSSTIFQSPDVINNFFIDSVPDLPVDVPSIAPNHNNISFYFSLLTESQILEAFSKIKSNACGLDGLPLKFIKIVLPFIISHLTHLYNFIILTGIFPDCWKQSKVFPLKKKPGNENLNNLRPISVLPCLSKAFEILVKQQIVNYTTSNNLTSVLQSGYKANHSTSTAVLKIVHENKNK